MRCLTRSRAASTPGRSCGRKYLIVTKSSMLSGIGVLEIVEVTKLFARDHQRVAPGLGPALALIADDDASGMGQAAAEACAERPMWATGSADNMRVLPPLPDVRTPATAQRTDPDEGVPEAGRVC
jgi:hypothetical protein